MSNICFLANRISYIAPQHFHNLLSSQFGSACLSVVFGWMASQGQSQKQWQIGDDLPLVIFEVQQKPWVHTYQEGDTLPQPCKHFGCKHKADAWRTLFLHVKNKHGLKIADYAGSYLHEAAKQAINSKMNGWRVEKGGWTKMSAKAKKIRATRAK